ncbi:YhgE/Pip domain-containing protein [Paenibacillus tyrfis]|uniref:ABC transporter n=1 Tax=Paenibacillus tyrfis TaxID=1501230 RepID=A0A081P1L0_9BACL|nr:ABC transporter permease [Paenibacillus tyrfis]KEQ24583.1 ABC transporter [Paenibacillus tyrfis]
MLQALRAYLKKPATIIGIVTAMMFQIIFSLVWMSGYQGVNENVKQLKIAVVNEDQGVGKRVEEQLVSSLPFRIICEPSLSRAQEKLSNREVQMVLHLPADFSKQLQAQGQKGRIDYYINESNPALIKSIMQGVANGVTAMVGKEAAAMGMQAMLVQANMPVAQAQSMAQGISDKVQSNIESVNPVQGMHNQMVPMMMVLASYVGAMIMGMNIQQATAMLGPSFSRWSKFGARVIINVVSAVFIALIGSSLVVAMGGQTAAGFVSLWLFQMLFLMAFMFFSQMFLIVFGMAGMLFNIAMLSIQLVSSGAMVPRELLGGFYHTFSEYLPATYAVDGGMNVLFGGPSVSSDAGALVAIMLCSLVVGLAATGLRREGRAAVKPAGAAAVNA